MSNREDPKPVYIDGLSEPPRSAGGSVMVKLAALCVIFVTGFWAYDRIQSRMSDSEAVARVEDLTRQIKNEERRIDEALRSKRAIIGMTRAQVLMAKGDPLRMQRGESVPDEVRKFGGVETWLYNVPGDPTKFVIFGSDGLVRFSSDDRP